MTINRIKIEDIKFNSIYTCCDCKKTAVGSTQYAAFDGHGIQKLDAFLLKLRPTAHAMPIGWASYYRDGGGTVYNCGCRELSTQQGASDGNQS